MYIEYLIKANSKEAFYYTGKNKAYISKNESGVKHYFQAFYCTDGTNYVNFSEFVKALGLDGVFRLVKNLPPFHYDWTGEHVTSEFLSYTALISSLAERYIKWLTKNRT
jgi:hypothetical protein